MGANISVDAAGRVQHSCNMQHDHQKANAKICGIDIVTSAGKQAFAGAGAGAALGGLVCGTSILGAMAVPGCAVSGGIAGASAGILNGMISAANGSACQNSILNVAPPPPPAPSHSGHKGGCPPMPTGLGNCPAHGVAHSCPSNPTPSRGGFRGAPASANCGSGSCGSSCGCK